jgi:hypothetical protein
MLCNRLASKSIFFAVAAILVVSFLMPKRVSAGICYNPNIAAECSSAKGAGSCISGQIYSIDNTCVNVQAAADLMEEASKPLAASESKKQGLGALKESVNTLTKAGGVTKSLEQVIGGYIKTALVLVGTLFMALTFYGGYIWFIAREDEEEAKRARSIISTALIGLIIVLAAYFVTYFIIYRLTVASGTGL